MAEKTTMRAEIIDCLKKGSGSFRIRNEDGAWELLRQRLHDGASFKDLTWQLKGEKRVEAKIAINLLSEFKDCLDHGSKFINRYGRDITSEMKEAIVTVNAIASQHSSVKDSGLAPDKIIRNGRATIVCWDRKGNDKTVVKLAEGQADDEYTAFCAALAKKIFGTNSKVKRIIRKATVVQEKKGAGGKDG